MKEIQISDSDRREETDIEEPERNSMVKVSAQSSFSDSGLGGYNSDSEDIGRGKTKNDVFQEMSSFKHVLVFVYFFRKCF